MSRREYYPESQPVPPVEVPEAGDYLWDWYSDISHRFLRVVDGICRPIPPSEWLAWREITGNIVYSWEFDILTAMDVAFCDETNREEAAKRSVAAEEAERKTQEAGRRR